MRADQTNGLKRCCIITLSSKEMGGYIPLQHYKKGSRKGIVGNIGYFFSKHINQRSLITPFINKKLIRQDSMVLFPGNGYHLPWR